MRRTIALLLFVALAALAAPYSADASPPAGRGVTKSEKINKAQSADQIISTVENTTVSVAEAGALVVSPPGTAAAGRFDYSTNAYRRDTSPPARLRTGRAESHANSMKTSGDCHGFGAVGYVLRR